MLINKERNAWVDQNKWNLGTEVARGTLAAAGLSVGTPKALGEAHGSPAAPVPQLLSSGAKAPHL